MHVNEQQIEQGSEPVEITPEMGEALVALKWLEGTYVRIETYVMEPERALVGRVYGVFESAHAVEETAACLVLGTGCGERTFVHVAVNEGAESTGNDETVKIVPNGSRGSGGYVEVGRMFVFAG